MNAATAGRSVDELIKSVSASRLATFHSCRLKFYFQYVLGLAAPKSPALHVGSAVHHALSLWNKARWRRQALPVERLLEAFTESWVNQGSEPIEWKEGEEAETRAEAWSLVKLYLKETPIPAGEPAEGVEVALEADLSCHGLTKVVGILDLVRPRGLVVDFKTTGQTPNAEKAGHLHEMQLSTYGVLYREATGRPETGFELHHLVKLKTPKLAVIALPAMTESQRTRLYHQIESYLEGVRRQDWVPAPHPMSCSCCEFYGPCRRWNGTSITPPPTVPASPADITSSPRPALTDVLQPDLLLADPAHRN